MDNQQYTYIAAEEKIGARTILDFVKLLPINYHYLNTVWIFRIPNERSDIVEFILNKRSWFETTFVIDID